ncbi:MAG: class I SAM-dependent RNA methyltransferase [Ruminococcaceae bacterium]|nr:class I SAM-dependent RNA methyltransferase [Oscillospiraceae bacterium]
MNEHIFTATCLFGLEKLLGNEIDAMGYKRIETINGRVTFSGPIEAICRFNIFSRFAERLFIKLGEFPAETFDMLFEGTKALPWYDWIGRDDAFPVKGHSIKSKLTSIPDCQSIVKKAVVESMKKEYSLSVFPEDGVKYQIEFFILNDKASLMIDTSGMALHKRGYRPGAGAAPIRETLAAALCQIARPHEDILFWDPMCGSATIPIEAALIATNTAPGINRHFVSEDFYDIPEKAWKNAREEAHDVIKRDSRFLAFASDIDESVLQAASASIERAGMKKHISLFKDDVRNISSDGRKGTVVMNPPYGERLMDIKSARELYKGIGKAFSALGDWHIYVITSDEEFEKYYGKRADKKRTLYNGMIKCCYYQYFKYHGKDNFSHERS